jgi:hypothetical protein
MPPHINEGKERPVGSAVEHELRVAQRRAQIVKIVGGVVGVVVGEIVRGGELRAARADQIARKEIPEVGRRIRCRRQATRQAVGSTHSTIVHQHDIVAVEQRRNLAKVAVGDIRRVWGRALARTAGNNCHRPVRRMRRLDDDEFDRNDAPALRGAVLVDIEGPAQRGQLCLPLRAWLHVQPECCGGARDGSGRHQHGRRDKHHHAERASLHAHSFPTVLDRSLGCQGLCAIVNL